MAAVPLIWLSLSILYVVWGSTYLAIRVAIDSLPPLLMASFRFLVAGALLFAWSIRFRDRGQERLGRRQWMAAFIVGGALLLGGNGGVVWAEGRVASGVVALLVATVPLWVALLDRLAFGHRLARRAVFGLFLGLGGLALLVGLPRSTRIDLLGAAVTVLAALSWAAGSLYSRGAPLPRSPFVATGMQMIAGGAMLGLVGLATGELDRVDPSSFTASSLFALGYLIVMGSLVAFTAYVWLLRVAPMSMVSTYAYVNPLVAVLLGWWLLGERITPATLVAGVVIVLAVALIVSAPRPRPRRAEAPRTPGSGQVVEAGKSRDLPGEVA